MSTKILIWIVAAALVVLAAGFWYVQQSGTNSSQEALKGLQMSQVVADQMRAGDLSGALQSYQSIVSSNTATPRTVASTVLVGSSLRYLTTGDAEDAKQSVKDLKVIAGSQDVRPFIRASAIQLIAQTYALTGYDNSVFEEIFKDDQYKQHIVMTSGTVDPPASILSLLRYSYQISPTFSAAIDIAENYVMRLYRNEARGFATPESNARISSSAAQYLARAADLLNSTTSEQPTNPEAYLTYIIKRAHVTGALAYFSGGVYKTQYKQAYQDAFQHMSQGGNVHARNLLAYTHFWYAVQLLRADNDTAGAKAELAEAVSIARANPNPEADALVILVQSVKKNPPLYQVPASIDDMAKISPEFRAFVDSIK